MCLAGLTERRDTTRTVCVPPVVLCHSPIPPIRESSWCVILPTSGSVRRRWVCLKVRPVDDCAGAISHRLRILVEKLRSFRQALFCQNGVFQPNRSCKRVWWRLSRHDLKVEVEVGICWTNPNRANLASEKEVESHQTIIQIISNYLRHLKRNGLSRVPTIPTGINISLLPYGCPHITASPPLPQSQSALSRIHLHTILQRSSTSPSLIRPQFRSLYPYPKQTMQTEAPKIRKADWDLMLRAFRGLRQARNPPSQKARRKEGIVRELIDGGVD